MCFLLSVVIVMAIVTMYVNDVNTRLNADVYKIIRFEFEGTCSKATGFLVFFFFYFLLILYIYLFFFIPVVHRHILHNTWTLYRHILTTSLDRYLDFVPPPFAQRHWTDT